MNLQIRFNELCELLNEFGHGEQVAEPKLFVSSLVAMCIMHLEWLVLIFIVNIVECLDFKYHSHEEIEEFMYTFDNSSKSFQSRLYSIGKSVNGSELWVIEVTAAEGNLQDIPNIQLIGNIHGNEPVGREILLHFLEHLSKKFDLDDRIRWLLKNTRIHILPCMNPDGFAIAKEQCNGNYGRYNANDEDLNRNFPTIYPSHINKEQPEMVAVRDWMKNISFQLSADFHGGSLVATFPYYAINSKDQNSYNRPSSVTVDDDVFHHIASVYATNHPFMPANISCDGETFEGGTIRGASWFSFSGGLQDYNYATQGTMGLTLEISCCKYPAAKNLSDYWEQNRESIMMFCSQIHIGITGQILDLVTEKPLLSADLKIIGREKVFHPNENGMFWKLLLPGQYDLEIKAPGYETIIKTFEVLDHKSSFPELTQLRISLRHSKKDE